MVAKKKSAKGGAARIYPGRCGFKDFLIPPPVYREFGHFETFKRGNVYESKFTLLGCFS